VISFDQAEKILLRYLWQDYSLRIRFFFFSFSSY